MKPNSTTGCLEFLLTKMLPITISTISLLLSTFNVTLTEEMIAVMQSRVDGEYPWPMEIETSSQ